MGHYDDIREEREEQERQERLERGAARKGMTVPEYEEWYKRMAQFDRGRLAYLEQERERKRRQREQDDIAFYLENKHEEEFQPGYKEAR